MNKVSGIYGIRSISHPERVYIGSATDIKRRWQGHQSLLNKNHHHSIKLQHHYNKYGINDLVFEVIIQCVNDNLIKAEQIFIDLYNPWFNIAPIAGTQLGSKRSQQIIKKMSDIGKTRRHSPESKKKISESHMGESNPFFGKSHSDKTKKLFTQQRAGNRNAGHLVINLETGIFYDSICEASRSTNIKACTLWSYLQGKLKNKTKFALV